MSVFGCHSCGVDITKYANYEDSPCATCKLAKEYYNTHRAAMFDSSGDPTNYDEDEDERLGVVDETFENFDQKQPKVDIREQSLDTIKEAIQNQMYIAMSGLIMKFVKLAKDNPIMFEVVIKKMQYPYMSYMEIGRSMQPPCKKQNVLYHLKRAVEMFPDLEKVILTDTRFSGGRYALQTIANRARQNNAKQRVQDILFGGMNPEFKSMRMSELNAILAAPFMAPDEAIDFNPYVEDEKK